MADAMPHYVYFLHQLTMVVYIIAFFIPVIANGELWDIDRSLLGKFAVMGGIDCLCTLIVIIAAPHVAGPIQILLMQGVLPATLVATRIAFGRKYLWVHYAGAAIIVGGILFSIFDPSTHAHAHSGDTHHGDDGGDGAPHQSGKEVILWSLFFFSFNIPAAISSVYKEYVFKNADREISINLLNAWVSVFQFAFGILWVPVVAPLQDTPFKDIPSNFAGGGICLFKHRDDHPDGGDFCAPYTTLVVFFCLFCNVAWNVFILLIIKHATATLMFVANTLTIPLANLGFSVPFVTQHGPTPRSRITWEGLVALSVTLLGLFVYQTKDEPEDEPESPSPNPQSPHPAPPTDGINSPLLPPRPPAHSPAPLSQHGTINGSSSARPIGVPAHTPQDTLLASPTLRRDQTVSSYRRATPSSSYMGRSFTRLGGASFTGIRHSSAASSANHPFSSPAPGALPGSPGDVVWASKRTYSQF